MKKLLSLVLVLALCITMLAACTTTGNPTATTNGGSTVDTAAALRSATSFLKDKYKNLLTVPQTAADFELTSSVMVAGTTYTVTWTVDKAEVKVVPGEGNVVTIDVNEKSPEDLAYVLTAVVTAADGTKGEPLSFNLTVPKYSVLSHAEYMAAKADEVITIEGIVTGINSVSQGNKRNHLFLTDASGKGGYYCYQMKTDPVTDGIKVGMTVSVSGTVAPYSGMQEIKDCTATIVDKTEKTVTPVDLTDVFKSATADTSFADYVGQLITVKGVTVGGQDLVKDTDQYLHFSIGNVNSYLRTYLTDMACGTSEADKTTIKNAIDTAQAAKYGWTANVTGIVVLYNKVPYLIPVSQNCFEYTELVEKTPAEKVESEKADLTVTDSINADAVIELPLVGKYYPADVTIAWVSDNAAAVVGADGKLTVTVPDKKTTVKLTATITCGSVTDTKEFTITLSKIITPLKEAAEIGKANADYTTDKYMIAGIITNIAQTTYGNMTIQDETGATLYIYGTYNADGSKKYGEMDVKPAVGDYVVVMGVLGSYKGDPQMKNGWIISHVTATTIPGALEIGGGYEKDKYSENKYMITGEITELKNEKYGNVIIKDADGKTILVYGLYSSNGEVRYDGMTTKPVVGDTITVLGVLGKYDDPQMKNGWLIGHTPANAGGNTGSGDSGNTGSGDSGNTGSGDSGSTTPPAGGATANADGSVTYDFSKYPQGVQYAKDEKHTLDANLKLTIDDAHLNTQIRLYHTVATDQYEGHHGVATFESGKVITKLVVNAGNKNDTLKISGSVDGVTWTVIQEVAVTSAYADYTVEIANSTYKFVKLESTAAQIRVAKLTVFYAA